jgi:type I restriction enzyme S subunit
MTFNGPIGGLIDFAIGGGWGSEVPKENHSRVAVIRGTDIPKVAAGEFSTVPLRYESDKKILNRILAPGDIVLETAGGSSANGQYTGRTLLITQEILDVLGPTICASFCKKLVLNKVLVTPPYFFFYMQDLYKSGRVASYDSQSTGISNFQYESFVNNEVLELPKLELQTSVAAALSNLQFKINTNSQISKTLEDIAQTIFKSWFIDFDPVKEKMAGEKPAGMDAATAALFPDAMEESELGTIPKDWTVRSLFDCGLEIESGSRPKGGVKGISSGVPSVGAESINGLGIFDFSKTKYVPRDFYDKMNKGKPQDFDILLYKDGGKPGEFKPRVGMYGLGFPFREYGINEHVFILRVQELGNPYLYFWIRMERTLDILRNRGVKAAIPGINQQDVGTIPILRPSQEILEAFNKLAMPSISLILTLASESMRLANLRDTLLPRFISGELQIPEEMLAS